MNMGASENIRGCSWAGKTLAQVESVAILGIHNPVNIQLKVLAFYRNRGYSVDSKGSSIEQGATVKLSEIFVVKLR